MTPETEAELADIVAGLDGPVRIAGGGTRGLDGPEPVLNLSGLHGITQYEPGALTLVAHAGTPVTEIEAALEAEGQQLALVGDRKLAFHLAREHDYAPVMVH